ncbi:MAG: GAF domain-containing protein [Gammaproteobacteria bacterium]|nr:GAF domain-containing protein [Gammaproteobacteria bacterium]
MKLAQAFQIGGKNTQHQHNKRYSSKGISLSVKVLILTLLISILVWKALDIIQSKDIREFFFAEHKKELERQSKADRQLFDHHVEKHHQGAKLIVSQKRFQTYVLGGNWLEQSAQNIVHHRRPPPWLPKRSVMRAFFYARYALLIGPEGRVREVYRHYPMDPPQALLEPGSLLDNISHNQRFMTAIEGFPYVISSQSFQNADGQMAATLMLASPMDNFFLDDVQGNSPPEGVVVALLSGDPLKILASANPDRLPEDVLASSLEEEFLMVAGSPFFDEGESSLTNTRFVSFVATEKIHRLAGEILQKINEQRTVFAVFLIISFLLLTFWITRRIRQVTQSIVTFSKETLGIEVPRTHRDELRQLFSAMQNMAVDLTRIIEDIVQVSQGLAKGDLLAMPKAEYKGNFVQIKQAMETTSRGLRSVIEDIVQISQDLAKGSLQVASKAEYNGDFILIKDALDATAAGLTQVSEDIVRVSRGLAKGDLHIAPQAEYKGNFVQIKDALGVLAKELQNVISETGKTLGQLSAGDMNIQISGEFAGDFAEIQNMLQSTAAQLAEATAKNTTEAWLKTGQTRLNEQVSGEQSLKQLAENVINFAAAYVEAQMGAFYLLEKYNDKSSRLKMIATHAYVWRESEANSFELGEGIVGQAGYEQKMFIITDTPEDYIPIQSGLGESAPQTILVIPFLYENTLKGVIELASFEMFGDIQLEFLKQAMPSIAIAVNTAESRARMQALLE